MNKSVGQDSQDKSRNYTKTGQCWRVSDIDKLERDVPLDSQHSAGKTAGLDGTLQ